MPAYTPNQFASQTTNAFYFSGVTTTLTDGSLLSTHIVYTYFSIPDSNVPTNAFVLVAKKVGIDGESTEANFAISDGTNQALYSRDATAYSIVPLEGGGWAALWVENDTFTTSGTNNQLKARSFAADGTPLTDVQTIDTSSKFFNITNANAVADGAGGWSAVWLNDDTGALTTASFNALGALSEPVEVIQTFADDVYDLITTTSAVDAGYAVSWVRTISSGLESALEFQTFAADGSADIAVTRINVAETGVIREHDFHSTPTGGWRAVWTQADPAASTTEIVFQTVDANGVALGPVATLDPAIATPLGQQLFESLALSDGSLYVVWQNDLDIVYAKIGANGTVLDTGTTDWTPPITGLKLAELDSGNIVFTNTSQTQLLSQTGEALITPQALSIIDENQIDVTVLPHNRWIVTSDPGAGAISQDYILLNSAFQYLDLTQEEVILSGDLDVGETVSVDVEGYDLQALDVNFIWQVDGAITEISKQNTYTIKEGDLGGVLSVTLQFDDPGFGVSQFAETEFEDVISDGNNAPMGQVFLDIDNGLGALIAEGDPVEIGYFIEADEWTYNDADGTTGVTPTLQWLRGGEAIEGATSNGYTVTAEDEGYKIRLATTICYMERPAMM